MAQILPDKNIKELIGTVLIGADAGCINPNGIELRLGSHVYFESTGEEKKLEAEQFLKVNPGESVIISSLEKLDFTSETVQQRYPGKALMAFITPTTTMMREGISQVSTKVDTGFRGVLNWGFRNSSTKEFLIGRGEPLFKLTVFLLEPGETPDVEYGQSETHRYQDTSGIKHSRRRIAAKIPKSAIVSSSFDKLDPRKQLREAGYPFDHIGTELVQLHGKFEIVSKDVALLKDQFQKQTESLSEKIEGETHAISERIGELRQSIFQSVEALFQRKFLRVGGILVGAVPILWSVCKLLDKKNVRIDIMVASGVFAGLAIIAVTWVLARESR